MGIRPRTDFVMKLKSRTCPEKVRREVNSQQVRCKRCHEVQRRPREERNSPPPPAAASSSASLLSASEKSW